jgi:glycosyltransferase involved in cell wall biosynthesis
MTNLLFTNLGLCRGREPEYKYYTRFCKITGIAFDNPNKHAEIRYTNINVIFSKVEPIFFIDPIKVFRGEFSVTSLATFTGVTEHIKNADVIVTQDPNFFSYGITKEAIKRNKPVVMINFENVLNKSIFDLYPYRLATNYVIKNSDLIIPQTLQAEKYLEKKGVKKDSLEMIYPGIDIDLFKPIDNKDMKEHDKINFLYVGTLTKSRSVVELLESYAIVEKELINTKLTIVGKGEYKEMLNEYKMKYNIIHLENIYPNTLSQIYRDSDVFVFLSRPRFFLGSTINEEQLSFAILEAMSSGLPIITTKYGSLPEVVGKDNFQVDPTNVKEISNTMLMLAKNYELRKKIGNVNRKRAIEKFDAKKQSEIFIKKILTFYS